MRTIIIALLLSISCNVFAQTLFDIFSPSTDDAFAAYERGDYQEAFSIYLSLAEQGNANAQYNLGVMYLVGQGVPENNTEAMRWYRLAAEQGYDRPQFNLGRMYDEGQGVPQNAVRAYVWVSVAVALGLEDVRSALNRVRNILTPAQLAQAQELATRCFESDFQDCE